MHTTKTTVNDFFPSNFLRAADLDGAELTVTIDHVEEEEFENDGAKQLKPVVHFKDDNIKPLVANKTNFILISKICGDSTDEWAGKQICLYPEMVPFKGTVNEAVRAKRPVQPAIDPQAPLAQTA